MGDAVLVTVRVVDPDVDVEPGEVYVLNSDPGKPFQFVAHSDDWFDMMRSQVRDEFQEVERHE